MRTLKVILVNLAVFIGLLLILELGVRFFTAENTPFSKRGEQNLLYSPSGFTRKWMNESQVIYETKEGKLLNDKVKFRINPQGYRDDDPLTPAKDSGEIRIAILGGSHVFDLNCFDHEGYKGFPAMLEDSLKAKGINARVINAGEPGADCQDFPAKILYGLADYKFDYIILNSTWNDVKWISAYTDTTLINKSAPLAVQKNPLIEPVNAYDRAFGWSVIYRKTRDYYWKKKLNVGENKNVNEGIRTAQAHTGGDFSKAMQRYKLNMAGAIEMVELVGAKPVLAIEERLIEVDNTDEEKKLINYSLTGLKTHEQLVSIFSAADSAMRALATERSLSLIDANKTVGGSTEYFSDHVHTTPLGSQKIASEYCRFFVELLGKQ
jgi:lysophospholipase L1-like esterase